MSNEDFKIKTIYNGVPKIEEMKHFLDIRNIQIKSREDLVNTCQVFRNPKYETFRIIYTRDYKIVGYESITSRLPNSCNIFKNKGKTPYLKNEIGFREMNERKYRLGANGYYLMHNHPSGTARASIEDIRITSKLAKNVDGFKGHVVIDHGTYAWIEVDERTGRIKAENNVMIENSLRENSVKFLSENPLLQVKVSSRNDLARIMYDVKHSNHYSSLVLTSATSNIRLFQELPNTFINMNYRQIGGYIKNKCCDTGSTRAFMATTDKPFFERAKELVKMGYLSDCVSYTINKDKAELLEAADKEYADQNIFESICKDYEKRKLEIER